MIEELVSWIRCGGKILGVVVLGFGFFSALKPQRSISLYQWIMERFTWRVTPIDAPRELLTTRPLGVRLVVLGLATVVLFSRAPVIQRWVCVYFPY